MWVCASGICASVLALLSWFGCGSMSLARIGTDTVDGTMVAGIKRCGMITDCILRWAGAVSSRIVVMSHPDGRCAFHPQCRHDRWIPLPGLFFCAVSQTHWAQSEVQTCSTLTWSLLRNSPSSLQTILRRHACCRSLSPLRSFRLGLLHTLHLLFLVSIPMSFPFLHPFLLLIGRKLHAPIRDLRPTDTAARLILLICKIS